MLPIVLACCLVQPKPADPYIDALAAAVHHFAEDGKAARLRAVLDKHPGLIEAKREQRFGKPTRGDGYTPLQTAAAAGKGEAVALLLEKRADVNVATGLGYTPLHLAAEGGHLEIVKQLVRAGAKGEAKTEALPGGVLPGAAAGEAPLTSDPIPTRTALQIAEDRKHPAVVEFLKGLK